LVKKKLSKNEQFFFELRDTIYPLVNIRLNNVKEILSKADEYVKTQSHIRKVSNKQYSKDLLIYIIGERYIDVVLEQMKKRLSETNEFQPTYQEFEDFVFRKIHNIGLFDIVIPEPELTPMRLIIDKREYMKQEFAKLNEETNKEIKQNEAKRIYEEIKNLSSVDEEINKIMINFKNQLKGVMADEV
jgi:hypothetical protein